MSDSVGAWWLPLVVLLLVPLSLFAADEATVVTVNGEALPLRALEDELLRKEGAEAVLELVERQLEVTDWSTVPDDGVVVAMADWRLPRLLVVAGLLSKHADRVREEMIHLMLVRQALERSGLTLDQEMIEDELDRMRRRFERTLVEEGRPVVAFENYIQETQGMPVEEWVTRSAFRTVAGLHHLLYRTYEVPEEELQRFFRAHYRQYQVEEAVDVSIMFMPYGGDGSPADDESRAATERLARNFHRNMREGRLTWERAWNLLTPGHQGTFGRKGWINRQGEAETLGEADVPPAVANHAFAHRLHGEEAVLLDPIIHDAGVTLMRVHGHRPAQRPSFQDLRERIRRDFFDADIEKWSRRYLNELRLAAEIDYASLADLLNRRKADARALVESLQPESD